MKKYNSNSTKGEKAPELPKISNLAKQKVDSLLASLTDQDVPTDTGGYPMVTVLTTQEALETVPDILSARKRNRRWGAVFSLAVIPGLDENTPGPVSLPLTPTHFFDSDSLESLKTRLLHELDKAIEIARMSKEDPEAFMHLQVEFMQKMQADRASYAQTAKGE